MTRVRALLFLIALTPNLLIAASAQLTTPAATPKQACKSLRALRIPASTLALPTTGATIKFTRLIHDSRGEYCKVLGDIWPVDPTADPIRCEVNLPTR